MVNKNAFQQEANCPLANKCVCVCVWGVIPKSWCEGILSYDAMGLEPPPHVNWWTATVENINFPQTVYTGAEMQGLLPVSNSSKI